MDARAEKIASFRYALVARVLQMLPHGELTRRAGEIAARKYEIPYSKRTSVSVHTLLDWVLRYRRGGVPGLAPQSRCDRGKSRVVPPQLAERIERLKRENPHRTGTTLLRELAVESGGASPGISAATLYRFLKERGLTTRQLLAAPAAKNFEAERSNHTLARKSRCDRGQSRVVPPQLAERIERLKHQNPHRTGMALLRELALGSGADSPGISAATLYRFLKERGLTTRQLLAAPAAKNFEAERSNEIWQSDMLFGPYVERPGGGRMRSFLYAVLDDASRLIPHAQFYTHPGLDAFLDCLRQAIAARGVCLRLYVDDVKIVRSSQLERIAESIGILIFHVPPHPAQLRSKRERFFRTLREQFLANLDSQRTLLLEELNQRLGVWIKKAYHDSENGDLGTTPLSRWQRDIEYVRQLDPSTDLRRLFFYRLNRPVRYDSTLKLRGQLYGAPSSLEGKTIEVRFDPLDHSEVEIYFHGEAQGLARPVGCAINASAHT